MTPASISTQIRRAIITLIEGTSLHVDDTDPGVLIITNPGRPDRGQIGVTTPEGYVSWLRERSEFHGDPFDHFGHLEGISPGHGTPGQSVPGLMIIHLLTARTSPPPLARWTGWPAN